jgi:pyridoxine 4-dehydrogenase
VRIRSLQVQISLLSRAALAPGGVAEVCRELEIDLIAYSPLALGLLARRQPMDDLPAAGPRRWVFGRLGPRLPPLLGLMAEIGQGRDAPLAAVALNWCRAHGALPIPGLRRPDQVPIVAAALDWQLTAEERLALDRAASRIELGMPENPFQSR